MDVKRCKRCETEKPLSDFYNDRSTKDGKSFYCKPCKKANNSDYVQRNPDKVRERIKAWHERNPGKSAAYSRESRARNPERAREVLLRSAKKWQAKNREYVLEYKRRKYRENVDASRAKKREYQRKRRAAGECWVTVSEEAEILAKTGGLCNYCDAEWEALDHFFPLSKGGAHSVENLVPACKPCNGSKYNADPFAWMEANERTPKIVPFED